ncbi:MAG: PepSY domain-containing protein [Chloroflexales bacterium]
MNTRTVRMFSAMMVAVVLMFVGDVIWSHTSSTASVAQPGAVQSRAYAISPDQAAIIAQDTAPGATITDAPMLITYQGTVAYAVPMDARTLYVEAATGRVLPDSAVVAASSTQHE